MALATFTGVNVKQAVPFFGVTNMEASLRFYVNGLGFKMKRWWIPDQADGQGAHNPDGGIRWCWLELGEAAVMLQEFRPNGLQQDATTSRQNKRSASQVLCAVGRSANPLPISSAIVSSGAWISPLRPAC